MNVPKCSASATTESTPWRATARASATAYDRTSGWEGHRSAGEPRSQVPELAGSIQFDGVSFRYPGQDRMIFDGLDLTIPIGRCTAIVGVNGAGKTTLVKLLARLYEPTAGTIRLNGIDIRSYPVEAWRAQLAALLTDVVGGDADRLTQPVDQFIHVLRLLTFAGSHDHVADGRLLTPEQIVDTVLHGTLRREA